MIKYKIKSENKNNFESWFSDSNEYEKLNKKHLLECIFCNSKKVKKSIMSPNLSGLKKKKGIQSNLKNNFLYDKNNLHKIRKYIENNFEYVGKNFSKKVREIYYDKKSKKTIYGTATEAEKKDLAEEGIDFLTIPWVNKDN